MGNVRAANPKRGVQIPGSYSDTEVLGVAMWDRHENTKPSQRLSHRSQSVLVVDDDAEQLKFLKRIIERAGFRVIASQSATEALDVLGEKPVDLIVSDYKMPEMDGFEFLQALRGVDTDGSGGDIPVIMLTACGDDLEFVSLERGADMFCEKFRAESLLVKQINFLLEM
ncbi:MAG: PleD family two-component system response regulator [Pseudomonadota bacterium]